MSLNFIMEDYSVGMIDNIEEAKENIRNSKYEFKKIYNKIEFKPLLSELGGSEELLDTFNKYSTTDMVNIKSSYKDEGMTSYDYIKIHINNTWAFVCEKDCYLPKPYYKKLYFSKNKYYDLVKEIKKNGLHNVDIASLKEELENNKLDYEKDKLFANNRKMDISRAEFDKRVDTYLDKISCNFKPVDIYEEENFGDEGSDIDMMEGWTDDNYAISYICKSLTGYFRNEYIKNMGLTTGNGKEFKTCCECGLYFVKKKFSPRKYCEKCSVEVNRRKTSKKYNKKH